MIEESETRPVVVGIDGSHTALQAAVWAAAEARALKAPVRLVQVLTPDGSPDADDASTSPELQYAETSLRAASSAVAAADGQIEVQTAILHGPPGAALAEESRAAALVCVGSSGIGHLASKVLGSTAMEVAAGAHCPVAVIRRPDDGTPGTGKQWIVVGVDADPANPDLVDRAMREAQVRSASVLVVGSWREDWDGSPGAEIGRRVEQLRSRYPGVEVSSVTTWTDLAGFLATHPEVDVQLAVVAEAEADDVADIVGPHGCSLVPHGNCSVLVVR